MSGTSVLAGPAKLYIGGEWAEASDGARRDIISPATGTKIADVPEGTTADADAAILLQPRDRPLDRPAKATQSCGRVFPALRNLGSHAAKIE